MAVQNWVDLFHNQMKMHFVLGKDWLTAAQLQNIFGFFFLGLPPERVSGQNAQRVRLCGAHNFTGPQPSPEYMKPVGLCAYLFTTP